MSRQLILASTSPYRRQLLRQLGLPFTAVAPDFEEVLDQQIAPELLVKHLAAGKARSLASRFGDALIIGADQVLVDPRGQVLGKPGDLAAARRQLQVMAGKRSCFFTGLALLDSASGALLSEVVRFEVQLRPLTSGQIDAYLQRERPFDCAGSFRIEGLGIALMERLAGEDYSSLIGLPLIALTRLLAACHCDPLQPC